MAPRDWCAQTAGLGLSIQFRQQTGLPGPTAVSRFLLVLGVLFFAANGACADESRMLFAGDILLAREVAHEIESSRGTSPWVGLKDEFRKAGFIFGNLEGSVGDPAGCLAKPELCFAIDSKLLPFLKDAGFTAVGVANNHSGDLGPEGRRETKKALAAVGVSPIGFPESPAFLRLGDRTIGLVNLNLVPARDGQVDAVPSWETAQKLRLARSLSDWVIVSVHWGKELADWVVPEQEAQAKWLVGQGADVIVGAHPHVVQPPACVAGKPVFYSLGNHVFDQKYPMTKHGLIADCRIKGDRLTCRSMATETPINSSFPRLSSAAADDNLAACPVSAGRPLTVSGQRIGPWSEDGGIIAGAISLEGRASTRRWLTVPKPLLGVQTGILTPGAAPMVFTLERHPSTIDAEDGPRPYVYDVGPGGLIARWRGSALAWPLLDAMLINDGAGRDYLCALHRGDSFIMLDPARPSAPRTQVYAWNGFGFSGVSRDDLNASCSEAFEQKRPG
jgi:poly-gamma-glutamate synthesis protein (capsule biosynthesis protein)